MHKSLLHSALGVSRTISIFTKRNQLEERNVEGTSSRHSQDWTILENVSAMIKEDDTKTTNQTRDKLSRAIHQDRDIVSRDN